ncbi:hypothetical protein F7734_51465 [Scytonema sp. UIC 10036]|uniref:hypothetical protein n=1 Tax=Scytonema sp. UIC 10036 TaxID=2304196 RepID=UPI0012DA2D9B|nr:hypothetical protein [Scytonema sp. UIC 10036]MUH00249.1 hypothetical protein [Scytonema sp. UIC 10036]
MLIPHLVPSLPPRSQPQAGNAFTLGSASSVKVTHKIMIQVTIPHLHSLRTLLLGG